MAAIIALGSELSRRVGIVSELPDGGPAVIQERLEDVEPGIGGVVEVVVDVVHQKDYAHPL